MAPPEVRAFLPVWLAYRHAGGMAQVENGGVIDKSAGKVTGIGAGDRMVKSGSFRDQMESEFKPRLAGVANKCVLPLIW